LFKELLLSDVGVVMRIVVVLAGVAFVVVDVQTDFVVFSSLSSQSSSWRPRLSIET
jgi:methenyltetrahydromethanopterin cyclohydrolase